VCKEIFFWSQKLSIDKSLVQNLFVGRNNNALRTTAQGCMNNCTTLYEQPHNAVRTAQRCTNNCTMLYGQLHNAVRTTAQRCTNNRINTVRTTSQCCMNNCSMLYKQLHNAAHRFAVSLPITSYTQTSFTLGWQLVTFPKSTIITCRDKLLLQHSLMEQRINIYLVIYIPQFWRSPTFTGMVIFEPVWTNWMMKWSKRTTSKLHFN
jgi:hypothetical protein